MRRGIIKKFLFVKSYCYRNNNNINNHSRNNSYSPLNNNLSLNSNRNDIVMNNNNNNNVVISFPVFCSFCGCDNNCFSSPDNINLCSECRRNGVTERVVQSLLSQETKQNDSNAQTKVNGNESCVLSDEELNFSFSPSSPLTPLIFDQLNQSSYLSDEVAASSSSVSSVSSICSTVSSDALFSLSSTHVSQIEQQEEQEEEQESVSSSSSSKRRNKIKFNQYGSEMGSINSDLLSFLRENSNIKENITYSNESMTMVGN
eukprot:c21828_g1_i4.p1 GENE.c21828_g1_i4~~c21828_g1_i4.p1  ORF type:complete len:259 (+),score=60.47 c21828_g1_i4:90-866(+)